MRKKKPGLAVYLRPQVLIAGFFFLICLSIFFRSFSTVSPELNLVVKEDLQAQASIETVQLVQFEPGLRPLERASFLELELPEQEGLRYQKILEALKELTLDEIWPSELPVPSVLMTEIGEENIRRVAVLNFTIDTPLAVSISQEQRLLSSIRTTLVRNGADGIRILMNNRTSPTFLGHVRLETSLE